MLYKLVIFLCLESEKQYASATLILIEKTSKQINSKVTKRTIVVFSRNCLIAEMSFWSIIQNNYFTGFKLKAIHHDKSRIHKVKYHKE
jgi:hypothetical protein